MDVNVRNYLKTYKSGTLRKNKNTFIITEENNEACNRRNNSNNYNYQPYDKEWITIPSSPDPLMVDRTNEETYVPVSKIVYNRNNDDMSSSFRDSFPSKNKNIASEPSFSRTGLGATLRRTTNNSIIVPGSVPSYSNRITNNNPTVPLTRFQRIQTILHGRQSSTTRSSQVTPKIDESAVQGASIVSTPHSDHSSKSKGDVRNDDGKYNIHNVSYNAVSNYYMTNNSGSIPRINNNFTYPTTNTKSIIHNNNSEAVDTKINRLASLEQALSSATRTLQLADKYLHNIKHKKGSSSLLLSSIIKPTVLSEKETQKMNAVTTRTKNHHGNKNNNVSLDYMSSYISPSPSSVIGDGIYAPSPQKLSKFIHPVLPTTTTIC